ncbi:restriction endonuclease subunit S [Colwellia sp. Bg11-28]|uniref:restriction endonuclease subunit S n=1 Tax=Colwellia sp. Bg11-28 TaxID=2058305 RepID=UPI000C34290C|nr:restriction endonuclease subunit S [Colwellia sp. Bg11-28]PKH88910.1 restriction endonuclease subunit S [Colwellia sp. Bg11-28]
MVPNGWKHTKLGSVAELQRGFDLPSSKRINGYIPIISSGGLSGYHNEFKVKPPGIVTGRYGTIGNVFYMEENFWPLNTSLWVKDFHGNEPFFIYYLLSSFDFKKFSDKTGVPGVNRNDLHAVKVFVPPKIEQRKIAKILSTWDRAISTNECLIDNSKQQKKALMQQLLTGKKRLLDNTGKQLSAEWNDVTIGSVLSIGGGKDYKHLSSGNIPVYGSGGHMLNVSEYLYDGESVCIGRKGTIDKPMFLNGKFWTVDTLFYTHSFINSLPQFIYQYFLTINWRKYSEASGVPSLSKSIIEKIKIKLPTLPEQKLIIEVLINADKEISLLEQQLDDFKQEKKALMQQLLTGKRRVLV